jgi:hypothetical protein
LIDLSFELSIPAHELAERLPYREFVMYEQYAIKRMLPMRRLEMYLAQIPYINSLIAGGKKELDDFLFDFSEQEVDLHEFFEFNPKGK